MLTDKVLYRFSTGVTWLCLLCILPNDWDSRRRVMTRTLSKWRRRVSAALAHFTASVCLFIGAAICVASYLHKQEFEQVIVNGIYFSVTFLVSVIALCCYHLDEQTVIVNMIMRKDKLFKEQMLTVNELKSLQNRPSHFTSTLVVLEIFSIIGTVAFGMIFFEDFDPFRRYVYTPLKTYLHLDRIPGHEAIAFLGYIIYIRSVASYIISTLLIIMLYIESTMFWLQFLTETKYEHSGSIEKLAQIYSIESVACRTANDLDILRISLPTLFFGSFFPIVSLAYLSIKWFGEVNWGMYATLPSAFLLLLLQLMYICRTIDQMHVLCEDFYRQCPQKQGNTHSATVSRKRKSKLGRNWLSKYIQSCQPLRFQILRMFHIRMATFVTYTMQVIDKSIMLLLS